ncbi:MAG: hypothetical protein LBJ12_06785 [Oscillospiraceae bacterium]|nr:hypothetical protein [Oscillospiraceae bacterium]
MAQIYYDRNAARKIAPSHAPQVPTPVRRPAPGPKVRPSVSPASLRVVTKRKAMAVLVAIALVLAWVVPSLIADASSEARAAAIVKADKIYEDALRDNIRLRNETQRAIPADEAYDTAIGEYGMIRADEDPVILD